MKKVFSIFLFTSRTFFGSEQIKHALAYFKDCAELKIATNRKNCIHQFQSNAVSLFQRKYSFHHCITGMVSLINAIDAKSLSGLSQERFGNNDS